MTHKVIQVPAARAKVSVSIRTLYESMTKNRAALELLSIGVVHGISTVVQPPCEDPSPF
ncbi:MAG: hypothetical protein ACTSRQ_17740 [Candidatus Thorarchaeota archaeon]